MSALPQLKYSINEYMEMEATSLEKHEFYQGEVFAMAGASIQHNQIVGNALYLLKAHLRKKGKCQVFPSDLKIHCQINSLFTYPDLSIVCGKIETLQKHKDVVTNPTVIIEVLSASTQDYDRGRKCKLYRDIPTLNEYMIISSMEFLVEKYEKQTNGAWLLNVYHREDLFTINSIEIQTIDLYEDVVFDQSA